MLINFNFNLVICQLTQSQNQKSHLPRALRYRSDIRRDSDGKSNFFHRESEGKSCLVRRSL
jgi:hypothetical protein